MSVCFVFFTLCTYASQFLLKKGHSANREGVALRNQDRCWSLRTERDAPAQRHFDQKHKLSALDHSLKKAISFC